LKTSPIFFVTRIRRVAIRCVIFLIAWCVCEPSALPFRTCGRFGQTSAPRVNGKTGSEPSCKIIYAGFVGALETSDHKASGLVQIRDTLRGPGYPDVCANSFLPYNPSTGLNWILEHLASHPGPLSIEDVQNAPKIIMIGHSTGGWAMLAVARQLQRRDIPVELTIQVDSVGITDITIPSNVKAGAIYHAHDLLMFMTTKQLRMEDAAKTRIVAAVLVKRANHLSITRDPRIRELILKTIEQLRAGTI
jgi:hypothetical protein